MLQSEPLCPICKLAPAVIKQCAYASSGSGWPGDSVPIDPIYGPCRECQQAIANQMGMQRDLCE